MATYPTNPASTFVEATDLAIFSANQLYDFVNGDITKELETEEGGLIPSVAKALNEAAAYKTPTAWVVGETQTDLMLLREYNSILYAPRMVPVVLGSSPTTGVSGEWRVFPTVENGKGIYNLTNPDTDIPFNDSIGIVKGFGDFDQIDVSSAQDGSIMVDLPSKSPLFSRSSDSSLITKGGEIAYVGTGEPAIGKDGIALFNISVNEILYSEDLSQWTDDTSADVSVSGAEVAPDGVSSVDLLQDNSVAAVAIRSQDFTSVDRRYTFSIHMKAGTALKSSISYTAPNINETFITVDWATQKLVEGDLGNSKLTYLVDGWVRVDLTTNITTGAGTTTFSIYPSGKSSPVTTTGNVYIWGAQVSANNCPYIKTEGSIGTRNSENVSIVRSGNFPAPGEPFTIVVDTAIPPQDLSGGGLASEKPAVFGVGASRALYLRRETPEDVWFNLSDDISPVVAKISADSNLHRYVCRYDGTTRDVFVDGVKGHTSGVGGRAYYSDSTLRLGREVINTNMLNGYIKNFRIYHYALPDDHIALLGSPRS